MHVISGWFFIGTKHIDGKGLSFLQPLLSFPSAMHQVQLVSSIPAVSVITTGPSGKISIDLLTGSVVVPATSDTKDTG